MGIKKFVSRSSNPQKNRILKVVIVKFPNNVIVDEYDTSKNNSIINNYEQVCDTKNRAFEVWYF
jgi:hypothetical protein